MKYLRSYQYIFDHKDWLMQVLMIALGMLIPVIGPIVLLGYSFELMEWLIANPDAKEYPKFDFSRFTENLKRGMWPFLTQLIISLVISVPVSLVAFVIMFIAGLLAKDAPILIVLAQIFLFVISMALGIVISVVTTPAMLHAGFKSKLDFSGLTAFVKDFAKRMWKETAIAMVFLIATAWALSFVGMCMFCIGIYFTSAVVYLAKDHLFYQLYILYLSRGGIAVHSTGRVPPPDDLLGNEPPPPPPPGPPDDRIRSA